MGGPAPSLITFLHVDLSWIVKRAFRFPKAKFWKRIGVSNPLENNCFDDDAVFRFWANQFHYSSMDASGFALERFSHIAINNISADWGDIAASRRKRDRITQLDLTPKWKHTQNRLYSDTESARRFYSSHVAGWQKWVDAMASAHRCNVISTRSDHQKNAFIVRGRDFRFCLSSS